jgi:hypothetical protein
MKTFMITTLALCACEFPVEGIGIPTSSTSSSSDGSTTEGLTGLDTSSSSSETTLGGVSGSVDDSSSSSDAESSSGDGSSSTGEPLVDSGLRFAGDGSAFTSTTSAASLASSFTVELWIRIDSESLSRGTVLDTDSWTLAFNDNGWLEFGYGTDPSSPTTWTVLFVGTTEDMGVGWHHVAVTRSVGVATSFLDGEIVTGPLAAPAPPDNDSEIHAAATLEDDERLTHVAIDDVRISSVARYTLAFAPAPIFESDDDTAAYWPLDEAEGASATDMVGALELQLTNAEWIAVSD